MLTLIEGFTEGELMVTKRDDRRQPTGDRVNIEQSASRRLEGRVLQHANSLFFLCPTLSEDIPHTTWQEAIFHHTFIPKILVHPPDSKPGH